MMEYHAPNKKKIAWTFATNGAGIGLWIDPGGDAVQLLHTDENHKAFADCTQRKLP